MQYSHDSRVYIERINEYDVGLIADMLRRSLGDISAMRDRRVVIKPNLVMKKSPSEAATTEPAVLEAVLRVLNENGISPVIAESPGGIYSAQRLENIYRGCGIREVADRYDCTLNFDVSSVKIGKFDIIKPIADAEVIFDLCRLKGHSMTKMSAAVKNMFGSVPGIVKFELHASHPRYDDFASMICDLCDLLMQGRRIIAVTDAVVAMEGEGPTGGDPRKIGFMSVSDSPFSADIVSAYIIGYEKDEVPMMRIASERGYVPADHNDIETVGIPAEEFYTPDFKKPCAAMANVKVLKFFSGGAIGAFFSAKPIITDKCRACGECAASCPQHTITIDKKRRRAVIGRDNCIRCFCCQELCPFKAIAVSRNPIISLIKSIK